MGILLYWNNYFQKIEGFEAKSLHTQIPPQEKASRKIPPSKMPPHLNTSQQNTSSSDEPKLEFSGLSRAKLGHFNFQAENKLTTNSIYCIVASTNMSQLVTCLG